MLFVIKSFSPEVVIVVKYPVCPWYVRSLAAVLADVYVAFANPRVVLDV
jgi:hypothetical protein